MAFEEIVAGPLSVYIAPVGTTFPTMDAAPSGDWALLGTNGDASYSEEGVEVMHDASFNKVRTAGAAGSVKALLDTEDFMLRLTLVDITLEEYARALNDNTVATTAAGSGTMGFKRAGLSRNAGKHAASEFALVARGISPEVETLPLQYCVPRVFNSANAQPVFRRGQPARLALSLEALHDPAASSASERFGYLQYGTAVALS
ncbi:MAG: hypothetical protein AAFZ11_01000 [Pseudomonadota bacterium]